MACSMGTLYVFLGGAPLVMRERLGGSSAALGLYMAMVPAGFILGSYLTGRWGPQIFRSRVLVCARILTWGALLAGVTITTWYDIGALTFFAFCVFIGIGNGLTTPAVSMGVMSGSADLAGTAMGLSAALSIGGAALISSVAGLFLGAAGSVHVLLILLLAPASLALLAAFAAALADRQPRAEESAVGA
jgi:MFS family permease